MAAASMASLSLRGGSSFQEFNGLAPSSSFRPSLAVPPTHRPCESLTDILVYPILMFLGLIATNILHMPLIELHLGPYPFSCAYHYQMSRLKELDQFRNRHQFFVSEVYGTCAFLSSCNLCAGHESMGGIVLVEN